MPPIVDILDTVVRRLEEQQEPIFGSVLGIIHNKSRIIVMGFEFDHNYLTRMTSESALSYASESSFVVYPAGLDYVGVIVIDDGSNENIEDEVKQRLNDIHVTNEPIFIRKDLQDNTLKLYYYHNRVLNICDGFCRMSFADYEHSFVMLRVLGSLPIEIPIHRSEDDSTLSLGDLDRASERISTGTIFRMHKCNLFLVEERTYLSVARTFGGLYDILEPNRSKDKYTGKEVLDIHALFPSQLLTGPSSSRQSPYLIDYTDPHDVPSTSTRDRVPDTDVEPTHIIRYNLPFDCLCIAHRDRLLTELHTMLLDAAERNITLCEPALRKYGQNPEKLAELKAYHFFPESLSYPLSLVFLPNNFDDELVDLRRALHASLCLPLERPIFRKGKALEFIDRDENPLPLVNVHVGVRQSRMRNPNSHKALVQGSYHYFHYNMDGFRDVGWGCAYRSLQTICSWFKIQGYCCEEVPTHKLIQETLVSIGDKPQSFIGSTQWIGSTEVSFYLSTGLHIESHLINLQTGSEMGSMGPRLFDHFTTHGTPVMIGGGVLAHTILGVDFDLETEEIYFLVLDPHYTGEHDLAKIQSRGFIGWKGVEFWDKKSFYNLCLPQRPICI